VKRIALLALIVITLSCLVLAGYKMGFIQFNYPSKNAYPVRGIDISHHQGTIDWEVLSKEDISFVYMKATEGGDFKDREFLDNWANAKSNNLYTGAYHFFTFCRPGSEQAKNFIDTVPHDDNSLPPAIDFEFSGNCKMRPGKEEVLQEIRIMVKLIEETFNKKPIFYVTYDAYDQYLKGEINDYSIWVRDVFFHPRLTDRRSWLIWQYSASGRINGIQGPVDLNVFCGSKSEFTSFARGEK
jgi:lysozyme